MLLTGLEEPDGREAIRVGNDALSYEQLHAAAGAVAERIAGATRVAVTAETKLETVVAVVGALAAGVPIVPVNPKSGEREREHIFSDSAPEIVLDDVDLTASGDWPEEPDDEAPAIVVYTSGTTGPPKGVVLPRRALATNLDALADAWEWTGDDVVAHGLPLFHVHGLILGMLGPLRRGGGAHHLGKFSTEAAAEALSGHATVLFGVPTMYHRMAADLENSQELAQAIGQARLLVSGSAALPAADHQRIEAATGLKPVERYGMSETLMNTAIRADGDRRAGTVGPPLPGVELRLVDDDGNELDVSDDETVGEIQVRGPNLFLEYLNRPDATEEAMKRRLVRHRRRRHPLRGRLHPDRRPARDRPDQERRLQDRRRRDRERAARASRGGRGRGHRRAGSGPRRADHRLDRRRGDPTSPARRNWPTTLRAC